MKNLSPIALFTYNRLWHTQQTVEALKRNELAKESELNIFLDGAKRETDLEKNEELRRYLRTIVGFKTVNIIERIENYGLAKSIIAGVTEIVNLHGKVIVLEDDMITSPSFLKYMNEALNLYESNERICSVNAYMFPINGLPNFFFLKGADCWGWGTWKRAWYLFEPDGRKLLNELLEINLVEEFEYVGMIDILKGFIDGTIDTWHIRWHTSLFLKNRLGLWPGHSLVENIGHDGSGTNCGESFELQDQSMISLKFESNMLPHEICEDIKARDTIKMFMRKPQVKTKKKLHLITEYLRRFKNT